VLVTLIAQTLSAEPSIWEFAHCYLPTGGVAVAWMGHTGSNFLTSWVMTLDGAPVTPTLNVVSAGQQVVITVAAYYRHPESVPNVATAVLSYTLTPTKFEIAYSITWLVAGIVSTGYFGMLPFDEIVDKGSNVLSTEDYTLNEDDGTIVGNKKSQAAYMWDADGEYGVLMYIPDLALVGNYENCTTRFLWIEDRSGGGINKIYGSTCESTLAVAVNEVWQSRVEYTVKRFVGGANTVLAR
jgi:hypothetical protein